MPGKSKPPVASVLMALEKFEASLVRDRNSINELLRVIRTLHSHLKYAEKELANASGTKAFYVLQKGYDAYESMAREILTQLEISVEDGDEPIGLAVPEVEVQEDPEPEVEEVIPKPLKLFWSPIAKTILESAFRREELPRTWEELMFASYGPQWKQISMSSLPPRNLPGTTVGDDIYSPDSSIRRTVHNGLNVLERLQSDETIIVNTDIRRVAGQFNNFPDVQERIAEWRLPPAPSA